jgi:predicted RNA-binding Zn ribbon-like protein
MGLKPETATELRGMVRELLRETMARRNGGTAAEPVRIGNDAELAAFVAQVIEPATLEAVRAGKLRFTLGAGPAAVSAPVANSIAALDGVITEQKLNRLSATGTITLAPGAVVTPLARDRARQLGLKFERRR